MTYKVVTTARYRRGNQYAQVRKGSKVFTDYGIETPEGEIVAVRWWEKKRAYHFAIALLSNGLSLEQVNFIDCDMMSDHAVIGVARKDQLSALENAARELIAKQ